MTDGPLERASQLALKLGWRERCTFGNFIADGNETVAAALAGMQRGERVLVVGAAGCGKTHLLQAACDAAHSSGTRFAYLPMRDLAGLEPSLLEGLGSNELVCVDDVDAVEQVLLERVRDHGGSR